MKPIYKLIFSLIAISIFSCTGEDEYKKYMAGGEISYTGKAGNLTASPGRNRIKLRYGLVKNPNINKTVIYWGSKQDSLVVNFDRSVLQTDTVETMINNLPEGSYSFEIYNFDKVGNMSVPSYVTARSYGNRYETGLYDRSLLSSEGLNLDGDIKLSWGDSIMTSVGVEIKYTSKTGEILSVRLNNDAKTVTLAGCNTAKPIMYRTFYIPEPIAIDTFATQFSTYKPENMVLNLDRTKFKEFRLNNDSPVREGNINTLWDGLICTNPDNFYDQVGYGNYNTGYNNETPASFTVDLGVRTELYRFRISFYWPWMADCPKRYELWGYTKDGEPPVNGDWSGWTKLHSFDNSNMTTRSHYAEGDNVIFDKREIAPKVRYVRIKSLECYRNPAMANISISEITAWAYL